MSIPWTTVAVTALPPGWVNVFDYSDVHGWALASDPVPAILLQERRGDDGEREVRTVAAAFSGGGLHPACEDGPLTATLPVTEWEAKRDAAGAK